MEEEAEVSHRQMCHEKARKTKERARKQREANAEQQQALDKFRTERAVQREAEEKASLVQVVPVSPELRRRIKNRNSALLRKLQEETQSLLRQRSEPVMKTWRNAAYQHVESNLYASTAVFSNRVAARSLTEPVQYESPSPATAP